MLLAAPPGYVEPQACRPCHRELFDRYLETPMGRSFYLPAPDKMAANWADATFYHEPSNRHYAMFRRGDSFYIRRYQLEEGRQVRILERQVTHVMGSGERARSYLHQTAEGRLYELPVAWYPQEGAWGMAPGYDRPNHPDFGRQVNHKCMFCHNGYPDVAPERARPGWDGDVIFPKSLPLGIDCQRCHGPGARHAESAHAADIVHPAKLSSTRSLEVCMQCHFETTTFRLPDSLRRFGRSFYSYEAGRPLGDYIVHFDHAPGSGRDDKFEIVSSAYRLRQSPCFLASSGKMTCLSCHNPHERPEPTERAAYYRERCLTCHPALGDHARAGDCIACHMPARRTEDVVHVVMTDHKIARRPPPGDLLAPREEKTEAEQIYRGEVVPVYPPGSARDDIYYGVAQVKDKSNLHAGIRSLDAALAADPVDAPEPWFELAEAFQAVGRGKRAEKAYRRSLAADPDFPQAWNNLANLLADQGRLKEAIEAHRSVLALTPHDAEGHVNLGLALLDANQLAFALDSFRAAVAANPAHPEGHANLGAALLKAGRIAEARVELETALALEPNHPQARHNLELLDTFTVQ